MYVSVSVRVGSARAYLCAVVVYAYLEKIKTKMGRSQPFLCSGLSFFPPFHSPCARRMSVSESSVGGDLDLSQVYPRAMLRVCSG